MAFDRDHTLKQGEKFLRQGRLEAAMGEYASVVDAHPHDWNTANLLGDLHFRASQIDQALALYHRIADHLMQEGFYPKAAAVYKKILKIHPDDERTELLLADISAKQGLLRDASTCLTAILNRRRARGDLAGVAEIAGRLGSLDPANFAARLEAAQTVEDLGQPGEAARLFRAIYSDLPADRLEESLAALQQAVRLNPADHDGRAILARAAVAAGDAQAARGYLDRDTADGDPLLLTALVDLDLRSGRIDDARSLMAELLAGDRELRHQLLDTAWALCEADPDAARACIDAVADSAIAAGELVEAATHLEAFAVRCPCHIATLLKLVEVCVDGGLDDAMYQAQVQLTDAYLANGQGLEARVIAEDLVAREPWKHLHVDRLRSALVMLDVDDPDARIAEHLSGGMSFIAASGFMDLSTDESAVPVEQPVATAAVAPMVSAAVSRTTGGGRRQLASSGAVQLGEIDLSIALDALDASATPTDLDLVFDDMRSDAEKQDAEFAAQCVTLADTYVEMGMLDEAIDSLKTAVRSPICRFQAAAMLGRLYLRRGEAAESIEWFEHAAEEPAPTAVEGRALLYDLGVVLDQTGELARALAVFLELQADAGDYGDVPGRIDRLARVQSGG